MLVIRLPSSRLRWISDRVSTEIFPTRGLLPGGIPARGLPRPWEEVIIPARGLLPGRLTARGLLRPWEEANELGEHRVAIRRLVTEVAMVRLVVVIAIRRRVVQQLALAQWVLVVLLMVVRLAETLLRVRRLQFLLVRQLLHSRFL